MYLYLKSICTLLPSNQHDMTINKNVMQVEFLVFFIDNRFTTLLNFLLQTLFEILKNIVILNCMTISLKEELKIQEGLSISLVDNKRTTSWLENTIRQTIVHSTQHRKLKTGTALTLQIQYS